ncbi:MAG: type VI secretion system Vgr family protein [Bryobacteraceae bacterium]
MQPAFLKILIDGGEPEEMALIEAGIVHQLNRHPSCKLRYRQLPESRRAFEKDIGKPLKVVAVSQDGVELEIFDGLVTCVETEYEMPGGCNIVYTGAGWSYLLDVTRRSRMFVKMKPTDIASDLLADRAGEIRLGGGSPLTLLQYGETDWSFLHRLLDRHGAFLRVAGAKVDVLEKFDADTCPLTWREEGSMYLFRTHGRVYECAWHGVNYDRARAESKELRDVSDDPPVEDSLGELRGGTDQGSRKNKLSDALYDKFLSGDHDRFQQELKLESRRRRIHACTACGESRDAAIPVGGKVEIKGEIETTGKYGVYRLEHLWQLGSGYFNRFWCMPFQVYLDEVRPAPSVIREAPLATQAPLPTQPPAPAPPVPHAAASTGRNFGVYVARVLDNADPIDAARVRVQFPWEKDANESNWAPVVTPHAGAGRGLYFMPEIGDEVLVAFEQGDPNRPIVLGCLWNGNDAPPNDGLHGDEQSNNDIKRIVTKSGNRMVFDDTDGKETIVVATPQHIRISMFEGDQTLLIHSDGDINIHAGGTVHIKCNQFLREVG